MPKDKDPHLTAEAMTAHALKSLADPAPPFKFPQPPSAEQLKRLARLEKQAVDQFVSAYRSSPLAMKILVLRAEING